MFTNQRKSRAGAPPTSTATWSGMCSILMAVASLGVAASAQTVVGATDPPKTQNATVADSEREPAAADVLALLPADSLAVVVARNLEALDEQSAPLLNRLDLPTHPVMPLLATLGVMTGIDQSRAAAIALLATKTESPLPGGLVLLLPTTNPAALIVMLQPDVVEDGVWRVTIRGRESYVGLRDGYAVVAAALATVQRVVRTRSSLATRLSDEQRQHLRTGDLFAWVDASILTGASRTAALDGWMRQTLGIRVETLSRYSDGCVSARFAPNGLRLRFLLRSQSAESMPDDAAALEAASVEWPGTPAAVAVEVANGKAGQRGRWLVNWVTQRLLDGNYIDATRVSELSAAFLGVADSVDAANLQIALSPDGAGGRMAATLMLHAPAGVKAPLESIQRLVQMFAGDVVVNTKLRLAMQHLQYVPAPETVAEIPVDHVSLDVSGLAAVDADAVHAVFGSEGLMARVGVIDGNPTVITLGGGSARFAADVAAVRSMRPALDADPQHAAGPATSSPFLKARVFVDQWLALGHMVNRLTGTGDDTVELPVLSEPVTLTMGRTSSGEIDVDVFLPADVIAAVRGGWLSDRSVSPRGSR